MLAKLSKHESFFRYPQYEVFGDTSVADTAQLSRRYTDASLKGVVTDINLLSYCDYLVCTFSSQVSISFRFIPH